MKKIMFNDKYGLTEAVLKGRKTMTRRIVPEMFRFSYGMANVEEVAKACCDDHDIFDYLTCHSPFRPFQYLAVAQSYKTISGTGEPVMLLGDEIGNTGKFEVINSKTTAGWDNKMFVKAWYMPYQIRITYINAERLQNISNEDCLKEGIYYDKEGGQSIGYPFAVPFYYTFDGAIGKNGKQLHWATPREAFMELIDRVSGKGTWDSNPIVWVYEFELVS